MVDIQEQVRKRIKKRGEIKSSKIYNTFRKVEGTKIPDRTLAKKIKNLEDNEIIERKGHGQSTVCIYVGE
jgi:DNA-binding HxlR family transcriptional regulator